MPEPKRLGFAGTPAFAATQLEALIEAGYDVVLVLSQPDRPRGRGRRPRPSPVKELALRHGLTVLTPRRIQEVEIAAYGLDLLVVAAYGLILPADTLSGPRLGCLNVHASLLPRWRGAAPVERAIMAGDRETGVSLMRMDEGLDTGPVYARKVVPIGAEETGTELEARLAHAGAHLLTDTLPELEGRTPVPQPETGVTYAHKLTPSDSHIDWAEGALALSRQIRALTDRQPVVAWSVAPGDPEPVRIRLLGATLGRDAGELQPEERAQPGRILAVDHQGLELACPDGSLRIRSVQLNRGKGRPMDARTAANGFPQLFAPGGRLLADPPGSTR